MPEIELTTMIMVHNKETSQVLMQDRTKSWKGLSFPGGHVEPHESFTDCAIREIKEETGLTITNLTPCGTIQWFHTEKHDRYLVFCYIATNFSGTLIEEMEEGRNFWMDLEDAKKVTSANGFERYLPIFLDENCTEAYGPYNDEEDMEIVYYRKKD